MSDVLLTAAAGVTDGELGRMVLAGLACLLILAVMIAADRGKAGSR